MSRVFPPPKPREPRYKYEVEDCVFVESIFPDFGLGVPMPERGRFARPAAGVGAAPEAGADKDHRPTDSVPS
jgi:hypothetical protein